MLSSSFEGVRLCFGSCLLRHRDLVDQGYHIISLPSVDGNVYKQGCVDYTMKNAVITNRKAFHTLRELHR